MNSKTPIELNPEQTRLDADLRRAAAEIHPRAAFRTELRAELAQAEALVQNKPGGLRHWLDLTWARPYVAQAVVVALLVGLVALALRLTPQLLGAPTAVPGQPGLDTPAPGQTLAPDNSLPAGMLARLGKGSITGLDSAAGGRLVVAATGGVCVYGQGFSEQWCRTLPGSASGARFNPAGDRLAVVSGMQLANTRVMVLDAVTGQTLAERETQTMWLGNFSLGSQPVWDPTGQPRLLINEDGGRISAWNWQANTNDWTAEVAASGQGQLLALDWAAGPGGASLIAAGGPNGLALIDGASGEVAQYYSPAWQVSPVSGIAALAFSPADADGKLMLAYTYPTGVGLLKVEGWDWKATTASGATAVKPGWALSGGELWQSSYQGVNLAWSRGSQPLELAVEANQSVQLFRLGEAQAVRSYPALGMTPLAWAQDFANLFYVGQDWQLFRAEGEGAVPVGLGYTAPQHMLAWVNAQQVLAGSSNSLYQWDLPEGRLGVVSQIPLPGANLLALQPSRALYDLQDAQHILVLWDTVENKEVTRYYAPGRMLKGALSPDGSLAVVAGEDGWLYVFDSRDSHQRDGMPITPTPNQVDGLALSPDGSRAAVAWMENGSTHIAVAKLDGSDEWEKWESALDSSATVQALAWSADGSRLAAAAGLNVLVIDPFTGEVMQNLGPEIDPQTFGTSQYQPGQIQSLAFAPEGQFLAAGGNLVSVWDLDSGKIAATYPGQERGARPSLP